MPETEKMFRELSQTEGERLLVIDHYVEAGIPRDVAEAIINCSHEIWLGVQELMGLEQFPHLNIYQRNMVRAIALGSVSDWCEARLGWANLGFQAALQHYMGGE